MARTSSYYLYERFEKRGDEDWIPSYPNVYSKDGDGTMPLVVRIARDYECGWHCDPEYQWVELPITSGYVCDECGELGQVTHKWEVAEDYLCEGTTKYQKLNLNGNVGNGWEEVSPIISKPGELIEENSLDCGYQNPRMRATLADGTVKEVPYAGQGVNPTAFLDAGKIMNYGIPISQIRIAEFYGTELYYDAFAGCQTLSSVTFHNAEQFYDGSFFFFSTGLRNFTGKIAGFGTGGWSANFIFANCKNLTAFTETSDRYHDGINGYGIFANCTGLTSVDLSMLGMYGIMDYDGGGGGAAYLFGGCTSLQTAKIALSVPGLDTTKRNSIPTACFDNCTGLTDVEIFCGFEYDGNIYGWKRFTVGDRAFFNCRNLTGITLSYHDEDAAPSDAGTVVTHEVSPLSGDTHIGSVGSFAFYGCTGLRSIELNCTDVTATQTSTNAYIGDYAFYGCTGLTEVILDEVNPPSLGTSAFDNTTCSIYVPAISVNTYRNAEGWSTYASRIQAIQ